MNSTPAPPSTACAAASIWFGVGEVNTWPGQAASSMPWPTKPACSGSWPEPPPEISATLPGLTSRRCTNWRSAPSVTMSAWAAAKPSRLSARTDSTSLMSFFMARPEGESKGVTERGDDQCHRARAGIDMAERAVTEERGATLDRRHLRGGLGAVVGALAHAGNQIVTTGGQNLLDGVEHVEQRLLADLDLA